MSFDTHTIETPTHGRYLVRTPQSAGPWPLLVGFHGYRENAAIHMGVLERIPDTDGWLLVAVQGLHRFYSKGSAVVASWMTREDRELAIADNVAYIRRVVDAVRAAHPVGNALVFAGFSQGTAMAFRAAAHIQAEGLIVVGGDVPSDVAAGSSVSLPPVLCTRGSRDELYTADFHARDIATLMRLGIPVESLTFDGGHEWTPELLAAAGRTLARFAPAI
jgi:predicted esterase